MTGTPSASPNTSRLYESHRRRFQAWCDERGVTALPCSTETFTEYTRHLIEVRQLAPASVVANTSAIRTWHPENQRPSREQARTLIDQWRREWAAAGNRPRQALRLTEREVALILLSCGQEAAIDLRDGALISLAWGTLHQGVDIASYSAADVHVRDDGVAITAAAATSATSTSTWHRKTSSATAASCAATTAPIRWPTHPTR